MHQLQIDHAFMCPHCGEDISTQIDMSVDEQTYIEDCEVCCSPIEISYSVVDEELVLFNAEPVT
jgi:transcription elongation factor Elf1